MTKKLTQSKAYPFTLLVKQIPKALPKALIVTSILCINMAHATLNDNDIKKYTNKMSSAINNKDINEVSKLIDDDALISVNRNGVSGVLNKTRYLQSLKEQWLNNEKYKFDMIVKDYVLIGNKAKLNIVTNETFIKNNKIVNQTSNSDTTIVNDSKKQKVVMKKSVSQITIK